MRDSAGVSITGKRVSVDVSTGDPCGNNQGVEGTETDPADGTYTVVVPGGTYYLRTYDNETNYVNEWWNGASLDPSDRDCSLATSITVASGDTVTDTDFRLEEAATISGTVRDRAGTPITGKRVSVDVFTGDPCGNNQGVEGTETDPADGTYTVVVPGGTYYLRTYDNETNYVNEWWNGASLDPSDRDCSLATSITVASGDTVTDTDFRLEEAATISGTVRDRAGTPITGKRVSVDVFTGDPCGNNQGVEGTETDPADGTYTVVVPGGTYYLRTHDNETNYVNEWWNGASLDPSDRDCSLATSITVASGDTVTDTDFRLEEAATISGTVRDSAGVSITGKRVSVDVSTGDPCGNNQGVEGTETDPADGTYTVVVPGGTYYLRTHYNETNYVNEWWNGASLDPSDRDCSLATSITVASGDTVTDTDFRLEEAATISGTVRDRAGTPITGKRVSVDVFTGDPCGNYEGVEWTETDPADGTYTVVVPAGTYYLLTHYYETNYVNEWWNGESPDPSDRDCSLATSITVASGDTVTDTDFKLDKDSDGDGITDYDEINVYGTDPNIADTDGDGIHDGDELDYWGPDWNDDLDGDGKINLVDEDSDNDGYLDGEEIWNGSDPTDPGYTHQNYLYDDFSGAFIEAQKWDQLEMVREANQQKLSSKIAYQDGFSRNRTKFQDNQAIYAIEADITIENTIVNYNGENAVFARVEGLFYNTQTPAPTSSLGDVWAGVHIMDDGNRLYAVYTIEESLSDDWSSKDVIVDNEITIPAGTLDYDKEIKVKIEYDSSANTFTFIVAGYGSTVASPTLPDRQGEPSVNYNSLTTGVGHYEPSSGYISSLFDNVYINNEVTVYDDFATGPLNPGLWNSREMVREITSDHKLLLAAHSEGQREQSTLSFYESQPYVEATVFVKSESNVFNGAVGRVRIDGYFFNDTHGPGEYNGYEGNVWAQIYIDLYDDGSLRAVGYVGKSMNSDESDWADLFWDEFSIPIQTDREYTLGIHYIGSHFVFKCKDNEALEEQYKIYPIAATNQYPAYSQYTSLRTRIYGNGSGSGYMKILVDDVYVITEPALSCPGDFDADGDVDGSDLAIFAADFGRTDCNGDCEGDFEKDGDVDGSDLAVFATDFGRTDCGISTHE